jgi:hypothetical protein
MTAHSIGLARDDGLLRLWRYLQLRQNQASVLHVKRKVDPDAYLFRAATAELISRGLL